MAIIRNENMVRPDMATNFDPYVFENYWMKGRNYPIQLSLFDNLPYSCKYTADDLKVAFMKYFRFDRQYNMCATEVEYCDVIVTNYDKTPIIEVETKVTFNDFLADFKKPKHHNYSILKGNTIPDYFYFGVPINLKERVLDYLNKCQYKHYGLLVYDKEWGTVYIEKQAKKININNEQRDRFFKAICKRCGSQLINFYDEKLKSLYQEDPK